MFLLEVQKNILSRQLQIWIGFLKSSLKCYYNYPYLKVCYSDRTFDFESLFMGLDLSASFNFESQVCYVNIILQCIRRATFNSLTFSYIFQVLIFQSHFYFYSSLIELSGNFAVNTGPNSKPDQSFSIC